MEEDSRGDGRKSTGSELASIDRSETSSLENSREKVKRRTHEPKFVGGEWEVQVIHICWLQWFRKGRR